MTNFSKIINLDRAWWIKTGAELSDEIITHTKDKKLDVNGHRFKGLSPKYAERKASGKIRRVGQGSSDANLFATGDMLGDLNVKRSGDNFVAIGWGRLESQKVVGNANQGRVITSSKKPLSSMVEKFLQKRIDKETQKNIRKNDKKNTIRLG